jgi:hypothetical protein
MFSKTKPKYQLLLEDELEESLRLLSVHHRDSEEYAKMLGYIERLHGMIDKDKQPPMSKDTLAAIGGNLLGIFMIIKHENLNVITSKALNFVLRTRA